METIPDPRTALSLLVVEDDKVVNEVLRLMIPRKFPAVTIYVADNGKMGLELCKEHAPDIVITDITMPEMDGIRMAEEIKSIKGDTRFIVLSGCCDEIHLDKLSEIGAIEYIIKPIEFKKLFTAIEKCIAEIAVERQ